MGSLNDCQDASAGCRGGCSCCQKLPRGVCVCGGVCTKLSTCCYVTLSRVLLWFLSLWTFLFSTQRRGKGGNSDMEPIDKWLITQGMVRTSPRKRFLLPTPLPLPRITPFIHLSSCPTQPLEIRQHKEFVSHLHPYLGQRENLHRFLVCTGQRPVSSLIICSITHHLRKRPGDQIASLYCLDLFMQYPLFEG